MARGWESKSAEQQIEQQQDERSAPTTTRPALSPAEQQCIRKRDGLQLARQRLLQQLQAACNPRHRHMLEQSLAELDRQLASIQPLTDQPAPK